MDAGADVDMNGCHATWRRSQECAQNARVPIGTGHCNELNKLTNPFVY